MFTNFFKSRFAPMLNIEFGGAAPTEPVDLGQEPANQEPGGENNPELAEPEGGMEPEVPVQTIEERAAFAAMRRELEQRERDLQEKNQIIEALFSDEEDPYMAAQSFITGRSPEEIAADAELLAQNSQLNAELEELRQYRQENTFRSDLETIRQVHPELKAKSIDDLGMEFISIMATGQLDPVTAYEIVQAKLQRNTATPPPAIGRVNQSTAAEKEYFTREEVKDMSQEEVSKNWEKIQASRLKWK